MRDVERRKDQTFDSLGVALWVRVVFGVVIFAALAAPDFLGAQASAWSAWPLTIIAVAYAIMLNSRRGSAVLGQPTRLRREEISTRFATIRRLVLMGVLVIGIVVAFIPHERLDVPYLRTGIGAVVGLALILFGDRYQKAMNSLARRDRAGHTPDGEGAGGTR
jgi:uncharacterized membrane protein YraQ (UPF0718 family)